MNLNQIKEMISLMNENDLSELEMEKEGMKIKLKKASAAASPQVEVSGISQGAQVISRVVAAAPVQTEVQAQSEAAQTPGTVTVKSPMVGTFFMAAAPDAPAFVEKGGQVEVGQVLSILEAMKLMNEIKSEFKGTIKEILVENGAPVEFGQQLFTIQVS